MIEVKGHDEYVLILDTDAHDLGVTIKDNHRGFMYKMTVPKDNIKQIKEYLDSILTKEEFQELFRNSKCANLDNTIKIPYERDKNVKS